MAKKQKNYVYFEQKPTTGFLEHATYDTSSRVLGRMCMDVTVIVNRRLVLLNRIVEPGKGLWLTGGRIDWGRFKDIFQYATLTAKTELGISVQNCKMELLQPRFYCWSKRPYPEAVFVVIINIDSKTFKKIKLRSAEQDALIVFDNKEELTNSLKKLKTGKTQSKVLLELWDELNGRQLVD